LISSLDPLTPKAFERVQALWAFGSLIGNADMHNGNLSYKAEQLGAHSDEAAFDTAPVYDMTPMSFSPTSSARLPNAIDPPFHCTST